MSNNLFSLLTQLTNLKKVVLENQCNFDNEMCDQITKLAKDIIERESRQGKEYEEIFNYMSRTNEEISICEKNSMFLRTVIAVLSTYYIKKNITDIYRMKFFNAFIKMQLYKNTIRNSSNNSNQTKTEFVGKGCVYTVLVGGYDNLADPQFINPDFEYIVFTDNQNIQSKVWKTRYLDNPMHLDNGRLSRTAKILPHKYLAEFDYSIYIDANCIIQRDVKDFIQKYSTGLPMLCLSHYTRDCIYEEEKACEELNKDNFEIMQMQMERYKLDGYPEHYGLISGGILIRDHRSIALQNAMEIWWNEILCGSKRDQLSFNYVCWKVNFYYDTCDLIIDSNDYFVFGSHN